MNMVTYLIERLIRETKKGEQAEKRAAEDSSHRCVAITRPAKSVFEEIDIFAIYLSKSEQSPTRSKKTSIPIINPLILVDIKHDLIGMTNAAV